MVTLLLVTAGLVATAAPAQAGCQANDARASMTIKAGYPMGYTIISYYCSGEYPFGGQGGVQLKTRGWSGYVQVTRDGRSESIVFCDWQTLNLWGTDLRYLNLYANKASWC